MSSYPLVVDLDGTLIRTDMLHESALRVLRDKPLDTLCIPLWLWRGKAVLKQRLAQETDFDPGSLPYNLELLNWLQQQRAQGRTLILCTASDRSIANRISAYLGMFDEVMASEGQINLAGKAKARLLEERFGHAGFDYAGNSSMDLPVWQNARRAVVANASVELARQAGQYCPVEKIFHAEPAGFPVWRKVLRVHQWLKNLLLFVPLLAAHQFGPKEIWLWLLLAFVSFCLCASSVYIANDLLDLESDRLHPRKCLRPFASGMVPAWKGMLLAPLLLLASLVLARFVGGTFLPCLMMYFGLTCAYSWRLKRLLLLDCLTLAILYTLRIVAGAAAANLIPSFWLLAFSVFLFLSLAFVKRYAELAVQAQRGQSVVHGRGYFTLDAPLLQTLGITAGYASVLVLALYLNSDAVIKLYRVPAFIWGAVPIMVFWISWIWAQAHRGNMHDDPLIFAVKDRSSLLAGAALALVLILGTLGTPIF